MKHTNIYASWIRLKCDEKVFGHDQWSKISCGAHASRHILTLPILHTYTHTYVWINIFVWHNASWQCVEIWRKVLSALNERKYWQEICGRSAAWCGCACGEVCVCVIESSFFIAPLNSAFHSIRLPQSFIENICAVNYNLWKQWKWLMWCDLTVQCVTF